MSNFLRKLHDGRYLSARLILCIDAAASLFASLCSVQFLHYLASPSGGGFEISLLWLGVTLLASLLFFYLFRTFTAIIRHFNLRDVGKFIYALLGKEALLALTLWWYPAIDLSAKYLTTLLFIDFLITFLVLIVIRVGMVLAYDAFKHYIKESNTHNNIFVYGSSEKSLALALRFQNSTHYRIVGMLNHGKHLRNTTIAGWKSYYFETEEDFALLCERYNIKAVLFATREELQSENERLVPYIVKQQLKALIAPPIDETGKAAGAQPQSVREIKIEDLLGRKEIKISMDEVIANFRGKVIMVTGAAGSIGSELVRQLATFGVKQLILFDNAETPMHNIRLELEERFPQLNFIPVIGDVRQERRLDFAFRKYRPQVVFHAAAYKHVPLMEENPCEAVLVNAVGSRFVADKCIEYDVEKMVMISTDKAVNPTNIMGCTKRLAEIYVQSLGLDIELGKTVGKTKFVTTRFGNVLGSNGSVIPRFRDQIAKGGPITVTHPEITRFFMTIPEACRLVMEAATMTDGNQIFVFDMGESVKIADLAKRMIELAGLKLDEDIKIEYTGLRPGEKLYEEVLSNTENTTPTHHNRIRIAKVREYDYNEALKLVEELERLSRQVEIPDMVRLMKRAVPEFISKNSVYEVYDKELKE